MTAAQRDEEGGLKVGWIGLGPVGTQMVLRALANGHEVTVYERGKGLEAARAAGAVVTADYQAVARDKDVVGLCVFDDAQSEQVLLEAGVLQAMRPASALVIHTTGSVDFIKRLPAAAPAGVEIVDATFSGDEQATEEGRLTLMVGADPAGLDRARPLLETYANQIHRVGELGAGRVLKALNNLLFAMNIQNAHTVLRLAREQGVDRATAAKVMGAASGQSYALNVFAGPAEPDQMLPTLRRYMRKDVGIAAEAAAAAGSDIAALASVRAFYDAE